MILMLQLVVLHYVRGYIISLNCYWGHVSIYDGNNTNAKVLREIGPYDLGGKVVSTGNALFVYFQAYSCDRFPGFSIEYKSMKGRIS